MSSSKARTYELFIFIILCGHHRASHNIYEIKQQYIFLWDAYLFYVISIKREKNLDVLFSLESFIADNSIISG